MSITVFIFIFFFFNDTATTEIYTLSLHDALPISPRPASIPSPTSTTSTSIPGTTSGRRSTCCGGDRSSCFFGQKRSEEHTSELQSRSDLVCRLLLEKKKKTRDTVHEVLARTVL